MRTIALAFALSLALVACKRSAEGPRPGSRALCTCTYLTDFDDTAHVDVDVCVEHGKDEKEAASFCALESAHNHIDGCSCRVGTQPCDARARDACKQR